MKRVLVFSLICFAGSVAGQRAALVDPTRPPNAPGDSSAQESAPPPGPQLQSVLISPTRRVAVISGDTVIQGEKYGGATVVAITEGAVLLRYADRNQTLHLIPGVVKRERRTEDAAHSEKGISR
ncbi:MAG: MSHA biogenesis protein MshK [Burkholderiales bacterium]